MSHLESEIRPGIYVDSIVLMRLQAALKGLPGILDTAAVMANAANLAILEANQLRPEDVAAHAEDLLVVVKAESADAAEAALAKIDELLHAHRPDDDDTYRPKSLATACRQLPEASWVLISVPGRHAARLAEEALDSGRNVFLYSDNVPLESEQALKRRAAAKGLLVMGPDCGTAIVGGAGLGFANRVESGYIGLVGASGTGLQTLISHLDRLEAGVSHAIGTGGRDLHEAIDAITACQGLDLLGRDPRTQVIILVSKPPPPAVAARLLAAARATGKPVVVDFIGHPPPTRQLANLHFATGLKETAELAAKLFHRANPANWRHRPAPGKSIAPPYLRALFAGGTLAYETLQGLRDFFTPLYANIAMNGVKRLDDPTTSRGHTVLDLGDDIFTVGRLHPMIDQDLRLRRLRQEAADPEAGWLLLDVVLGDGAHPDPAGELAPVIAEIRRQRPELEILAMVIGTEKDPQNREGQIETLRSAGASIFDDPSSAIAHLIAQLPTTAPSWPEVPLAVLASPLTAINVGLEAFHDSLISQGARVLQVDWRPPAGGNDALLAILDRLKSD